MPPEFARDIRRTLLLDTLNRRIRLLLRGSHPLRRGFPADLGSADVGVEGPTPHLPSLSGGDSDCPIPLSIAFNDGISVDFFSCGY